jgi:signal recognition particle subunit SRP54
MVLDTFGGSLKRIFNKITGYSLVDKEKVESVIIELQRALIQADVDVGLVAELSERIRKSVLKKKMLPSMTLKEVLIKSLYDELVWFLGQEPGHVDLKGQKILLIGLFGSGKTTQAGKIAKWFQTRGVQAGMVACDTHRPAAQDQLAQLGKKIKVPVHADGKDPLEIAKKAMKKSKAPVLIFDSAGRDALDKELAGELRDMGKAVKPDEVWLVIPAELGQDAGRQASEFSKLVGITGIVVTKMDGTAKGGAALAACRAAGASVRFIGKGEQPGDIELYDPKRFIGRLIGYGDLAGLLEKAKEAGVDEDAARRMLEGKFTMSDFQEQLRSMQGMGPLNRIMDMIPGASSGLMKKLPKGFMDVQEGKMKKWGHIIRSMTPGEKDKPETINAGRVKRISAGSGTKQQEVRELLKSYKQIRKVMKLTKGGKAFKRGPFAKLAKQLGMGL